MTIRICVDVLKSAVSRLVKPGSVELCIKRQIIDCAQRSEPRHASVRSQICEDLRIHGINAIDAHLDGTVLYQTHMVSLHLFERWERLSSTSRGFIAQEIVDNDMPVWRSGIEVRDYVGSARSKTETFSDGATLFKSPPIASSMSLAELPEYRGHALNINRMIYSHATTPF